ncbi:MAG: hypothetical protein AB1414_14620 [bacterium]
MNAFLILIVVVIIAGICVASGNINNFNLFCILFLLFLVIQLRSKFKTILDRIESIEEDLEDLKNIQSTHLPEEIEPALPSLDESKFAEPQPQPAFEVQSVTAEKVQIQEVSPILKTKSDWLPKLTEKFAENWTGIFGAITMVMGVAFLGIYAALKCTPFYRFIIIVIFSGILTVLFFILKEKPPWRKLALWLRSSAGAIFLFACLGSGGIPGLQWILDPFNALALLLVGISVNVYLSYIGKTPLYASFHVVLNLIALSIAPQTTIVFIVAGIVTLLGIVINYKEKWEYHLITCISSFFLYHLYWYFTKTGEMTDIQHYLGMGNVALVSFTALLVHYRDIYKTEKFEYISFISHFLNWFYFGIGIWIHSFDFNGRPIIIIVGAFVAFFIAQKAKKKGIRWVYTTDMLVAQIGILLAIVSMTMWKMEIYYLLGLMYLETLLYSFVVLKENERLLFRIGIWLANVLSLILLITAFKSINFSDTMLLYKHSTTLLITVVIGVLFHLYQTKYGGEVFDCISVYITKTGSEYLHKFSVSGILLPIMGFTVYFHLAQMMWGPVVAMIIGISFLYARQKYQLNGFGIGIFLYLLGVYYLGWYKIYMFNNWDEKIIYSLPFFFLSFASIKLSYIEKINNYAKYIGIYLLYIHLAFTVHYAFNSISPFISGIVWLCICVINLEIATFLRTKYDDTIIQKGSPDRSLMHIGYIFIGLFLIRHICVHLQSEIYIGFIQLRFLIELFALLIFVYWLLHKKPQMQIIDKHWIRIYPLMVELIVFFSVLTIAVELSSKWYPVAWGISAFICLFLGQTFSSRLSQLKFYSLLFSWANAFHVAFKTAVEITPSTKWHEQSWMSGLIAIVLQFMYIVWIHRKNIFTSLEFPLILKFFSHWVGVIQKRKNLWIYYPLFLSITMFLYFSFEKSILTLLFVLECFFIFVISLILREDNFRYLSMAGLVLCLIRLIFYDLVQAGTLMRAVVFLCVGIIMLGMNFIYTKYKQRQ